MGFARRRARLLVTLPALALVAPVVTAASIPGSVIVRKSGGGRSGALVDALSQSVPNARVVDLTGDGPADAARISREAKGSPVLFAIGPDAAEVAREAQGTAVVALGVANPAQVKTPGTYVSIYPEMDHVFQYLKNNLKVTRVGLVFSPAKNREVALQFLKAGTANGVTVTPVTISSSGDLVREIKQAMPKVDALVLAVDPVLFDQRSLEFIVREAEEAKKPTIGFLEELTTLGVTLSLVVTPRASAAAAVVASEDPVFVGKKRVEVGGTMVIASRKAAETIGLDPEALGAQKIQ